MIKLPNIKYVPKHNKELREYAIGWNSIITEAEYLCDKYGDESTKKDLLKSQEYNSKRKEMPYFNGCYDCIVEIERLNEEVVEHRLDNFFKDSLEALDNLTIKSDDELDKKLEELNKYNEDRQLRML